MLKDALDWLKTNLQPRSFEATAADGNKYTYGPSGSPVVVPRAALPQSLTFFTLRSLVLYVGSGIDLGRDSPAFLDVDPTEVFLRGPVEGFDAQRTQLARAVCAYKAFPFDEWLDLERFTVLLMSRFVHGDDPPGQTLAQLLNTLRAVDSGKTEIRSDDGVSQTVAVTSGVQLRASAEIKNPLELRPFRTFVEVGQPTSLFVCRLRKTGERVEASLFESDGNRWRIEASRLIAEELTRLTVGVEAGIDINIFY